MKKIMLILVGLVIVSCAITIWLNSKMVRFLLPANAKGLRSFEVVDLNLEDVFNQKPLAQLMQEQHKQDLPYIIARVVSKNESGERVRYCNAHDLNRLFGGYPFKSSKVPYSQKTPQKGFLVHDIEYYVLNSPNDLSFLYFCSYYDLMVDAANRDMLRLLFYANQVKDTELHLKALRRLAADERIDPAIAAKATMRLGDIYYEGRFGIPKDYERALFYFQKAANQDANAGIAVCAQRRLDQLYCCGHGIAKEDQRGCKYFATKRSGFTRIKCSYYVW